jgi:hypothetical protein
LALVKPFVTLRKAAAVGVVAAVAWLGACADSFAAVTFSGTTTNSMDNEVLSASVTFDLTNAGTELVVSLSNTGNPVTSPVTSPSDILGGVFFNLTGVGNLTTVSAVLGAGSILETNSTPVTPPAGTTLGDYWDYAGGISGAPHGDNQGIASTGYIGAFGSGNFGSNPVNVDGFDYGIVNGNTGAGNDHVPTTPVVNNTMVFTLTNLPAGFSLSQVSSVVFQYGTSLSEASINAVLVPEPGVAALVGFGVAGFLVSRRRLGR